MKKLKGMYRKMFFLELLMNYLQEDDNLKRLTSRTVLSNALTQQAPPRRS